MTANQGPGVPNDLRERLINVMQFLSLPLEVINDDQACAAIEADAILAEIAASGHVIVRTDRLERLNDVGTHALAYWEYQFAHVVATDGVSELPDKARLLGLACMLLEDGDLDPVEPGAGR